MLIRKNTTPSPTPARTTAYLFFIRISSIIAAGASASNRPKNWIISAEGRFRVSKTGVISAKGIELAVRPDYMCAAAINPVLVPRPRIHEGLDEKPEGVGLIEFKLLQQSAERFRFTTTLHQIIEAVTDLIAQKALHLREVDEVAHGPE